MQSHSGGEYNVCQFFPNDSYEYVRRYVDGEEAIKAFLFYTTNVASKMGITRRVILTDGGDCVVIEWLAGKGYTSDGTTFTGTLHDFLVNAKSQLLQN